MSNIGRPTKLIPETIKKLEEVFAMDGTVKEACFYADISTQTYYTFVKDKPEFLDRAINGGCHHLSCHHLSVE
jgi:hypothetical protein